MLVLKHFKPSNRKLRAKLIEKFKSQVSTDIDQGISAILSAMGDFRDYLIIAFNDKIVGAVSYYFKKKKSKCIEIDHLGVTEKRAGYGTALMAEVFNFAMRTRCDVSLVSNGYANEFYERMGMKCVNNGKMPSVYQIDLSDIVLQHKK
jgi:N-acetylglutamate synthase-like GNAT family acetyltransferase